MRKVLLSQIKGNEILAKNIYDDEGRILMAQGVQIRPVFVGKLEKMGISAIYIHDELSDGVVTEEIISEETKTKTKNAIKEVTSKYVMTGRANFDSILKSVNSIIDEVLNQKDILISSSDIRSKDEQIFGHSVNVCALSVITGIHMGYNMLRLKEVAIGALMHDLGKVMIPKDILNKGSALDAVELEIIKKHPKDGYDILGKDIGVSAISKVAVLMHHERVDGSGFPLGVRGGEIHEVAKLVAICDTFDKLVTDRPHMKAMYVYEAVEYLTAMGGKHFDNQIVRKFIENIAIYPSGTGVILNNKFKAIVLRQNKGLPTRPVIRIVYDEKGDRLSDAKEVDLSKEMTIFILGSCEI